MHEFASDEIVSRGLQGGCQCGAVRYRLLAKPDKIYICHCVECRRQSASAFGISTITALKNFQITKGSVKSWSRTTSADATLTCCFCPICGTRIYHLSNDEAGYVSVKGGTLDEPPDLTLVSHIWTCRAMPGIIIPDGAERFDQESERSSDLIY